MSRRRYFVTQGEREVAVDVEATSPGHFVAHVSGEDAPRELVVLSTGRVATVSTAGHVLECHGCEDGSIVVRPGRTRLVVSRHAGNDASGAGKSAGAEAVLRAPMPGRVFKLLVREGDTVRAGAALLVVEAMKMENELAADRDGTVKRVLVKEGDAVERDAPLVELE